MDNQNSVPNPTPTTENTPAQNSPVQETPPSQVYTAPQSSTPPPSPKSFLSTKILLLIVIGLIIIGGGGTYLALNSKPKPAPIVSNVTPTPLPTEASAKAGTTDPTATWKIYADSKLNFQFNYPPDYSITKTVDGPYPGTDILNHNITWGIDSLTDMANCRGDGCRYSTGSQTLKLGNNSVNKVIGYVGSVGGNIPQNYVDYEITISNSTKVIIFRIQELPADKSYQELIKQYSDSGRTLQEIPKVEIDALEKILSTFQFSN